MIKLYHHLLYLVKGTLNMLQCYIQRLLAQTFVGVWLGLLRDLLRTLLKVPQNIKVENQITKYNDWHWLSRGVSLLVPLSWK